MTKVHGWIILDKPVGLGSTQAVSAVKRVLRECDLWGAKKADRPKVGHGGTLDPLANGVLPIAIGEATKLTGRMLDASKIYEFTIAFGAQTDTLDAEGKVIATSDNRPTAAEAEDILSRFTGAIEQVPPAYSALKVEGKRAYDLARAGDEVELKRRPVTIHALDTVSQDGHCGALTSLTLRAHVSKGTYIRSLARDIALALNSVGHVTMLKRTRAGPFDLSQAISLDKLNDFANAAALEAALLPLEAGLDDIPALPLSSDEAETVSHGGRIDGKAVGDGLYFAVTGDIPVALMEAEAGTLRVVRGFNL